MRPIEFSVEGRFRQPAREMCEKLLDLSRWPGFHGYSVLPGIRGASFLLRTPGVAGTRIAVTSTDGSTHVEEIVTWDPGKAVLIRFEGFGGSLARIADHFEEEWSFTAEGGLTVAVRSMRMYPRGAAGRLLLAPIARMMKKAFEIHRDEAIAAERAGERPAG